MGANISRHLAEIEQARQQLLVCPNQPGWLRLSRHACVLRYCLAQEWKEIFPEDEFGIARKVGLEICRSCPQGRSLAMKLQDHGDPSRRQDHPIAPKNREPKLK